MHNGTWTALVVAGRLREAADTLRRLPLDHPGRRMTSSWPDIVRSFKDLRRPGLDGPTRVAPSAPAIDRMDEVLLEWLPWLEGEEVKILWGWMANIPAAPVARRLGISRSTLHRRRAAILKKLAVLLNARGRAVAESKD